MDTHRILSGLRAELNRLNQAIAALEGLDSAPVAKPGRPKGGTTFEFGANKPTGRGRHLSAAGRARIAAAAKARWAKLKAAKPAKAGRRISAAGRKRIAEAAKRMWARRKKAAAPTKTATAKKAASAHHLSPATRKRLSELAKARWAQRKKATAA
jgi:hypothetical protein